MKSVGFISTYYEAAAVKKRPWPHLTEDTSNVYITATALESVRKTEGSKNLNAIRAVIR